MPSSASAHNVRGRRAGDRETETDQRTAQAGLISSSRRHAASYWRSGSEHAPLSHNGIVARASYLQQQTDTTRNTLKPWLDGFAYALCPKMKSSGIETINGVKRVILSRVRLDGAGVLISSPLLLPSGCAYQKIETNQFTAWRPRLASQIISF